MNKIKRLTAIFLSTTIIMSLCTCGIYAETEVQPADTGTEELSLDEYKIHSDVFDSDLYQAIYLKNCVEKRTSEGGTSLTSVQKQLAFVKGAIGL